MYADAAAVERDLAALLRPPAELSVAQAAVEHVQLSIPGGYSGPWSNDLPHYMVEPAECLTDRRLNSVIFAGPSQCAKTQALVDNFIAYTVKVDPVDMMVVQTTQDQARDFSRRRIDRMHVHSPSIGAELAPYAHADNTHDKVYRSGIILSIQWPTQSIFRGKPIGRVVLTDVDGMPDDIGGDGSPYELAEGRTKSFGSRGMVVAESSPAREQTTLAWTPEHPHEAPPTSGILGLFNMGDRRRAYCRCQHCGEFWLQPHGMENVWMPEGGADDLERRIEEMGLTCPICAAINTMREHERALKRSVRWVKQGQTINAHGEIAGEPLASRRASFWFPGWFAAFERWGNLVRRHALATDAFERSGDEKPLKALYNTGFGTVYVSAARRRGDGLTAEDLEGRVEQLTARGEVPAAARYVVAAVDVQASRFVVQVEAFGVAGESWIVDRFDISVSARLDEDGRRMGLSPATHAEDWTLLEHEVIRREWAIEGEEDRRIRAARVVCDMHGAPGVTERAYAFWRQCRARGLGRTFRLVRGDRHADSRVRETTPDQTGAGGKRVAGDVPVLQLNVDRLKDMARASIERLDDGPGRLHLPDWLERWWFEEVLAERRTDKGRYEKEAGARNEALDLLGYARAASLSLGAEAIDWERAPAWAVPLAENTNTCGREAPKRDTSRAAAIFGSSPAPSDPYLR